VWRSLATEKGLLAVLGVGDEGDSGYSSYSETASVSVGSHFILYHSEFIDCCNEIRLGIRQCKLKW
jgi:hypothetical protein